MAQRRVRTFFIWFCGVLACMIVGGGLGSALDQFNGGGFWGAIAGALTFTCFRLWTAQPR
jgi:hypothetical protein